MILPDFLRVNFQVPFQEIHKAKLNLATTYCYIVSGDVKIYKNISSHKDRSPFFGSAYTILIYLNMCSHFLNTNIDLFFS